MTDVDTRTGTPVWGAWVEELCCGVVLCDRAGAVVTANAPAAELLGLTAADLVDGTRPAHWRACDPIGAPTPPLTVLVRQVLRTGTRVTFPVVITTATERRTLLVAITPAPNPIGAVVELRAVQADLRESAGLLDAVTGLPNAVLLTDRLGQAVARTRTLGGLVSLVLADVRGLARLNTVLGVRHADALLADLAGRLRTGLRADHTVARYGGGTFAIVAEHQSGDGTAIADQVRELAGDVTVAVGLACTDGRMMGHELLARAEKALR